MPIGISRRRGAGARKSRATLSQIVLGSLARDLDGRCQSGHVLVPVASHRSKVDRDLFGVAAADRRLAAFVPIGRDHLACSVEEQIACLLDGPSASDDCRPLGQLRHCDWRSPVLSRLAADRTIVWNATTMSSCLVIRLLQ